MQDKKSNIFLKVFRSGYLRLMGIVFSVIFFILIVLLALNIELNQYQDSFLEAIEKDQQMIVDQTALDVAMMLEDSKSQKEIIDYISLLPADGGRYFVYIVDDEVVFAKNQITTGSLGSLSEKHRFYEGVVTVGVESVTKSFVYDDEYYELAIIYDEQTVLANSQILKHRYFIIIYVVIMSAVLLALLTTIVGAWNTVSKQLDGTKRELSIRNLKFENIAMETKEVTGDKTNITPVNSNEIGIIETEKGQFYSAYAVNMLIDKSEDDTILPLQMIHINIEMGDKYFTKREIFTMMRRIQKRLLVTELIGEVRKGEYIILLYRTSEEKGRERFALFEEISKTIYKENDVMLNMKFIPQDERSARERYMIEVLGEQL